MDAKDIGSGLPCPPSRRGGAVLLVACVCLGLTGGCAAVTNPVADGVPVRRLPEELLCHPRAGAVTIPLTLLGQKPPDVYRLAPGDVLGVWVEGVLGDRVTAPPIIAPSVHLRDQRRVPPGMGYPIQVREDGSIVLPMIDPVSVKGMTLAEAQEAIRAAYAAKKILKAGAETVIVTLLHARQHSVLVMRQEAASFTPTAEGVINSSKRGTGFVVDLPAYENDVLHALAQTGGLPGDDAYNEIIIHRACFQDAAARNMLAQQFMANPTANPLGGTIPGAPGMLTPDWTKAVTRIPLRMKPGKALPFGPEDVVLCSGDVVFLEARDCEVFFTAGLLPAGEHLLPRDRPIDVIEAIARVRGPMVNGAFATNNLSGNLIAQGIGDDNPSMLVVVRRLPDGRQLPIRVDLNRALQDSRERIFVQPGDVLILQETPCAALARYFGKTFFNFSLAWQVLHEKFATAVIDIAAPERLPNRITVGSVTTR